MKKVFSTILISSLLICAMVFPTEFGDLKVTTTTVIHDTFARSNRKSADRTRTVEAGDSVIAKITLSATFGYDGKTAWVISASGSHTTYDGWSYNSEKISKSGGTATLTASLFKLSAGTIPISFSMTCSPTGQIS